MRVFWFSLHDSMSDQWEKKKKLEENVVSLLYTICSRLEFDNVQIPWKFEW